MIHIPKVMQELGHLETKKKGESNGTQHTDSNQESLSVNSGQFRACE